MNALSPGVYDALRTRQKTSFFRLERHLARIEASCAAFDLPAPNEDHLRQALDQAVRVFDQEARVRIDFHHEPARHLGASSPILLMVKALDLPPQELYEQGVSIRATRILRRPTPKTKTTAFINARARLQRAPDDFESVMLDEEGFLLECLMSNITFIQGSTVRTAGHSVLGGIARETLLQCAESLGLAVELSAVHESEVAHMDEAFLSSAVRGVMPVTRFQGAPLGTGKKGPVTTALATRYAEWAAADSRPAWPRD